MKKLFVSDIRALEVGSQVQESFRVRSCKLGKAKNDSLYITIELSDRAGRIVGKWWKRRQEDFDAISEIRYAQVTGVVKTFNNEKEIEIESFLAINDPDDETEFCLAASLSYTELRERLNKHINSVKDKHLSKLLHAIFDDASFRSKFDEAPAAKKNHHACHRGLLQHTIEVTDVAAAIAAVQQTWGYRPINCDLVVASALLHDIGKVHEMKWADENYEYSSMGSLLGHITIGQQLVLKKIGSITKFPVMLRDMLLHAILAHHGKGEFGSPVRPAFAEAQVVHNADLIDVQLYYMNANSVDASEDVVWVKLLEDRQVYTRAWKSEIEEVDLIAEAETIYEGTSLPVFRFATNSKSDRTFTTRDVPLLGRVAAGTPISATVISDEFLEIDVENLPVGDLFVLKVDGDSMIGDNIYDGDLVLAKSQSKCNPEEIAVVLLTDNDVATIKRIQWNDKKLYLVSSNKSFDDIHISNPQDVLVRGRVVGRLSNEG